MNEVEIETEVIQEEIIIDSVHQSSPIKTEKHSPVKTVQISPKKKNSKKCSKEVVEENEKDDGTFKKSPRDSKLSDKDIEKVLRDGKLRKSFNVTIVRSVQTKAEDKRKLDGNASEDEVEVVKSIDISETDKTKELNDTGKDSMETKDLLNDTGKDSVETKDLLNDTGKDSVETKDVDKTQNESGKWKDDLYCILQLK